MVGVGGRVGAIAHHEGAATARVGGRVGGWMGGGAVAWAAGSEMKAGKGCAGLC